MASCKIAVLVLAFAGAVLAYPGGHAESYASVIQHSVPIAIHHEPVKHEEHHEHIILAHPKYDFKYGVEDHHTGDHKDAKEERDGDVVKGEYSLLQPDGRKRIVHYTSSKHGGFNAIVSYSGHAIHPEVHSHGHY
ncbi:adult-specific cuticular protein ACP-20-like [Thrips palmi]|uniref:Adult-specific cuticular protein ACP-20-like n=1 Tax=Thrips palmi TaxID=161013 RepID=A0A6P8Z078_THRPL|nr:adult-specific cuticular protein ACP-20-like [Thrips palmi]